MNKLSLFVRVSALSLIVLLFSPMNVFATSSQNENIGESLLYKKINKLAEQYYQEAHIDSRGPFEEEKRFQHISYPHDIFELTGSQLGEPILTGKERIYIGETTKGFPNTTPTPQKFLTPIFSRSVFFTDTTVTNNQSQFKLGTANIPIVGKYFSAELNFDTSTNTTIKHSHKITYTVPSQSIEVPPGKTYGVRIYLDKTRYNGKVKLKAKTWRPTETIRIHYQYKSNHWGWPTWYDADMPSLFDDIYWHNPQRFKDQGLLYTSNARSAKEANELRYYGNKNKLNTTVSCEADAEYSTEVGTDYYMEIYDMTNPKKVLKTENIAIAE